jgi:hypothetical protein
LNKFHWEPSRFATLPFKEKAMVIAMIDERLKQEKKEAAKIKRKGGRRR